MKYNLFSWMEDKQNLVLRAEHATKTESTLPWDLSRAGVSSLCEIVAKSLFIHSHKLEEGKILVYLGHSHTHAQEWNHFESVRQNLLTEMLQKNTWRMLTISLKRNRTPPNPLPQNKISSHNSSYCSGKTLKFFSECPRISFYCKQFSGATHGTYFCKRQWR